MAALELQTEILRKLAKTAGLVRDVDLAARIGINQSNLSRTLAKKAEPGNRFIAGCIAAFGYEWFADLFHLAEDTGDGES